MSDHIDQLINDATTKLREQEKAVAEIKKFINQVCQFAGRQPIYSDGELTVEAASTASFVVTRNAFYGKPLATCVREFLNGRERGSTREATLEEIMEALKVGSYDLDAITKDKDGQKRGVAISLAKNNQTFHRLPNGDWGLTEWYPNVKAKKEKSNSGKPEEPAAPTPEKTDDTADSEQSPAEDGNKEDISEEESA